MILSREDHKGHYTPALQVQSIPNFVGQNVKLSLPEEKTSPRHSGCKHIVVADGWDPRSLEAFLNVTRRRNRRELTKCKECDAL